MCSTLAGSWPYPQTLDQAGKACQGQTLLAYSENLELTSVKRFITLATDEDITLKTLDFGKRVDKKLLRFGDKKFAKIFISYEDQKYGEEPYEARGYQSAIVDTEIVGVVIDSFQNLPRENVIKH